MKLDFLEVANKALTRKYVSLEIFLLEINLFSPRSNTFFPSKFVVFSRNESFFPQNKVFSRQNEAFFTTSSLLLTVRNMERKT